MAMAVGKEGLENDINVVPMIDVLLVLLIIFMAALPSMRKAIDIQLPDPTQKPPPQQKPPDQIVLEVLPGGIYRINKEEVDRSRLPGRLTEIFAPRPDKIIFVKGDPQVKYQAVIDAMDVSRGAGVKVIGIPPGTLGNPAAPASP